MHAYDDDAHLHDIFYVAKVKVYVVNFRVNCITGTITGAVGVT